MKPLINLILVIMVIYFAYDSWQIELNAKTVMNQIVSSMAMIKVLLVGIIIVVFNNTNKKNYTNEVNSAEVSTSNSTPKSKREEVYAKLVNKHPTPHTTDVNESNKQRQGIGVLFLIILVMGVSALTA